VTGAWQHWTVSDADPPTPGAREHWVLRPDSPVADLTRLDIGAKIEMWQVLHALVDDAPGWCMVTRAATHDPRVVQVDVTVADITSDTTIRLALFAPVRMLCTATKSFPVLDVCVLEAHACQQQREHPYPWHRCACAATWRDPTSKDRT
jgi:hypothetical protein